MVEIEYIPRIVDDDLQLRLEAIGATLLLGPKGCGKTTTALQHAQSMLSLDDPEMQKQAMSKPSRLLKGEKPRLIDEWQKAPYLWDAVRISVDNLGQPGLYILTGSTVVDLRKILHTGTGRISRLRMYPMSLYESGESNGKISLKALFDDTAFDCDGLTSDLDSDALIFATLRGGWPASLGLQTDAARLGVVGDIVKDICDAPHRSPEKMKQFLRSYARNLSQPTSSEQLIKGSAGMSASTFYDYARYLRSIFVLEDVEVWGTRNLPAANKREFIDPSIAAALLQLTPEALETDLKTYGFLFESLCVRDLRIYAQKLGGHVSYYRNRYGLEADMVLHLDDGRYALIECKLGSREIESGARHLLEICDLIAEHNKTEVQVPLRSPDFLMILTAGKLAYVRKDGVRVVPIGCLKD